MLIRVRSNVGVWRVDNLEPTTATVSDVLDGIAITRPHVQYEQPLSLDPACKTKIDTTKTLNEQGLRHGSMIYCRVDPTTCADLKDPNETTDAAATGDDGPAPTGGTHMKRIIDKDGQIKLVPSNEARAPGEDKGFRRGMMPLRDMKMQWTLNEFVALDSQFEFKIKRQEKANCAQVSLDSPSVMDFQAYCQQFNFQRKRFGYLYGKFIPYDGDDGDDSKMDDTNEEKKKDTVMSSSTSKDNDDDESKPPMKAVVEAIYEPPQEVDPDAAEGFVILDDPNEAKVDEIANMLGLRKVGWIFCHPPREDGFVMNAAEIIMAGEFQLEAADGVAETPFVTVKVSMGVDGNVSVEAFQVSQQCMAMIAEEALEIDTNPGFCKINDTFTAIQEGKESKTVDNNFFLTVVPIVSHTSETFVSKFPKDHRDVLTLEDRKPSKDELKRQLSLSGTAGWTFVDLLADFHLLIYLSQFLDINADMPKICTSIVDRDVPLPDGYKIIITSIAGMDGSY